jgi:hypothetical protein
MSESDRRMGQSTTQGNSPSGSSSGSSSGEQTSASMRGLAEDAGRALKENVRSQQEGIADRVEGVAESVRRSADELREHEAWLADLVERGSHELTGMAETLRSNDLGQLLSRVQGFARRQPALFAGVTVAAGFALGRLAISSTSHSSGYGGRSGRSYPTSSQDTGYGDEGRYGPTYGEPGRSRTSTYGEPSSGAYGQPGAGTSGSTSGIVDPPRSTKPVGGSSYGAPSSGAGSFGSTSTAGDTARSTKPVGGEVGP